jgi:uncharacterized protein (TIGR02231 family)
MFIAGGFVMMTIHFSRLQMGAVLGIWALMIYPACAVEIPVTSKIEAVTVYPGAARITRQIQADVPVAGAQQLIVSDIISQIDESSLSVSGKGSAPVKIYGAYLKKEYLTVAGDERVRELEAQIERLSDAIQKETDHLTTLQRQQKFLDNIQLYTDKQVPQDLVTTMPSVDYLQQTLTFITNEQNRILSSQQEVQQTLRQLKREKETYQHKLAEIQQGSHRERQTVVIEVEASRPGRLTVDVSYLVNGLANWRPVYDARAAHQEARIELTAFGMVQQTTAEDWSDVQLTLSTARPSIGGRMPQVTPWILQAPQPQPFVRGMAKSGAAGLDIANGQYAVYSLEADAVAPPQEVPAEMVYSQVDQAGIAIVYKITRPASVKSDGSESQFPILTQELKADFEYSTYPRLKPYAYLGSVVKNSPDVQLLPGPVNLFLEGDFVGRSDIDLIARGEEFNLYLGVDEGVKVKREQIERKVDDVLIGGIPSPNRKITSKHKIILENYKSYPIKLHLFEAMPVSENERIKIKIHEVSTPPSDKDWKDRKGVWHWGLTLAPNETREIIYSFSVEHPRDMPLADF